MCAYITYFQHRYAPIYIYNIQFCDTRFFLILIIIIPLININKSLLNSFIYRRFKSEFIILSRLFINDPAGAGAEKLLLSGSARAHFNISGAALLYIFGIVICLISVLRVSWQPATLILPVFWRREYQLRSPLIRRRRSNPKTDLKGAASVKSPAEFESTTPAEIKSIVKGPFQINNAPAPLGLRRAANQ